MRMNIQIINIFMIHGNSFYLDNSDFSANSNFVFELAD